LGYSFWDHLVADAANPVRVDDTLGFGSATGDTATDIVSTADFDLTLDVAVFFGGGVFTYVYTITHTADVLNSLSIMNGLFNHHAWGWVGAPDADAADLLGPFGVPVIVAPLLTIFQFDADFPLNKTMTIYIQSDLGPTPTATEFFFGSGTGGPTGTFDGQTLGPTDQGGGASFYVPEPSSLLLLSFGLLSGAVFRINIRRTRGQ